MEQALQWELLPLVVELQEAVVMELALLLELAVAQELRPSLLAEAEQLEQPQVAVVAVALRLLPAQKMVEKVVMVGLLYHMLRLLDQLLL